MTTRTTNPIVIGRTESGSSTSRINLIVTAGSKEQSLVGKFVYFDTEIEEALTDGGGTKKLTARALGTITDVMTKAPRLESDLEKLNYNSDLPGLPYNSDIKLVSFNVQSSYVKDHEDINGVWKKRSSAVPTSPSSGTNICLADKDTMKELLGSETDTLVFLGKMRGLGIDAPLIIPDFADKNGGAYHTAFVGRSGSGKTVCASYYVPLFFNHQDHGIITIDPQGQWSSEHGFKVSPQAIAHYMGREVSVFRVSEDIKLPYNSELLAELIQYLNVWNKAFRRMGAENQLAFSEMVANALVRLIFIDKEYDAFSPEKVRDSLTKVFTKIHNSESRLKRIYASKDTREEFKSMLGLICDIPFEDAEGQVAEPGENDEEERDEVWEALESRFIPLLNLFHSTNLSGKTRESFGGDKGIITRMMENQAKTNDDITKTPAPYIILDMSSDVAGSAKASYAQATNVDGSVLEGMKKILDDENFKAVLVKNILLDIKEASERAYANKTNLNTQIVFDEAWRYARPTTSEDSDAIVQLSNMLAGFALDTRKYGIGWTYILQLPSNLHPTIFGQTSNLYAGHGVTGNERRYLEDKIDEQDRKGQMNLYSQFIHPKMTGDFPFMFNGHISPLIFTNSPTFVNIYTNAEDYLHANEEWLVETNGSKKKKLTLSQITTRPASLSGKSKTASGDKLSYRVGGGEAAKPKAVSQTRGQEPSNVKEFGFDIFGEESDAPF